MTQTSYRHVRQLKGGAKHTFFCFWDSKQSRWVAHLIGTPQYVSSPTLGGVIRLADEIFDRMEQLAELIRVVLEADIRDGVIRDARHMDQRCHALACIASQL